MDCAGGATLDTVVPEGLSKEVASEQRPEWQVQSPVLTSVAGTERRQGEW